MPIIHKHQRATYTIVDNQALRDEALSWRATGMLAYLLSLPDNWNVNIEDLTRRKTDGRAAARSTLQELKNAGYVILEETRDDQGHFNRVLHVHETCQSVIDQNATDSSLFTDDGLPDFGPPDFGEPDTKNKPEGNTEKEITIQNQIAPGDAHNQMMETIVQAMGWDREEVSDPMWAQIRKASKLLRDMGVDPWGQEVARRARIYLVNQPGKLSPLALVKWWSDCGEPRVKPSEREIRTAMRRVELSDALGGLE